MDNTRILGFDFQTLIQVIFQLIAVIVLILIIILVVYCIKLLINVLKKKSRLLDLEIEEKERGNSNT